MQLHDLHLDGHRYDVRVLATPLEYLTFLAESGRTPGDGGPFGLAAVVQQDLEHIVEAQADDAHRIVKVRDFDRVCACGLALPLDVDPGLSTGHRDLRSWGLLH